MEIGKRIKDLRTEKGMTQKDLADQLFITPQALSRYENGTAEPPLDAVLKMAEIFGVTSDELLGRNNQPKEEKAEEPVQAEPVKIIEKETIIEKAVVPVATCQKCGKHLYKEEDVVRSEGHTKSRHGRHTRYTPVTNIYCKDCAAKLAEERAAYAAKERARLAKRGRAFRIWSYIGGTAFGALMAVIAYFSFNAGYPSLAIPMAIVFGVCGMFLAACFILGNTYVIDVAQAMIKFGVKLPFGIIFHDLFDWIVFKIIMFIVGILVFIVTFSFTIVVAGTLAIFTYPYALVKAYKSPEECW